MTPSGLERVGAILPLMEIRINRSPKRQRKVTMLDLVRVFGWPMPFDPGLALSSYWRRTGVARHKRSEQIGSARVISQSISGVPGAERG
jgi:hypothetical protein